MAKERTNKISHRAKFLVYVDESESARIAVRFACSKAKIKKRPVEMIFVIDPSDYNSLLAVGDVMKRDKRKEVEELLEEISKEAHEWSGITPSIHIEEGDAKEKLFKCIENDLDINMLIISSDPSASSGGTKLLGEIADAVDHRLHIPVMIVPAHLTDTEIQELN